MIARLVLAPPLVQTYGWESVFYLFGFLGLTWFTGFQFVQKDQTSPSATHLSFPQGDPGNKSLSSSLQEFGGSAQVELNLDLTEAAAWVSLLPPLASIFVTSIASQYADDLIKKGIETTVVRKLCQTIAFLSPATCMIISSVDLGLSPWEIVLVLTSGLALSSFALSGLYCTHQDISPEYASILLGITNTFGAIPGIVGVALTGVPSQLNSFMGYATFCTVDLLLSYRYSSMVGSSKQ